MELSAERVREVLRRSLAAGKSVPGIVVVQGIVNTYGFDPAKIAEAKPDILALLGELPTEFRDEKGGGGGGWSFLNACMDQHGNQWGEHSNMEELVCLGIAAGAARWLLPRDQWNMLPGGMPYFVVTLE
jgi:hypothetical protein